MPKIIFLLVLLLLSGKAYCGFGFKLDGNLDKDAITKAYYEGDFGRIRPVLEVFRKDYPKKTREDSIFVYKYLSVIYAAEPATRHKAESYMMQLVKMMPSVEIIDMYVSDNIMHLFDKTKKDYLRQQEYMRRNKVAAVDAAKPAVAAATSKAIQKDPAKPKSPSRAWIGWTLGAATVVATGVYFMTEFADQEQASEPKERVIDGRGN